MATADFPDSGALLILLQSGVEKLLACSGIE